MQELDSILRLIEAMEKAGVNINDNGAIHSAADYFDRLADVKRWGNTQTVSGDIHMQYGIEMDIKLLEETLENQQKEYHGIALNAWHKGYFWSSANSIALLKTQLNEFPWY